MEIITMKRGVAGFLQAAVVLFGIAILTFLLWEPHIEGRNAHATTFEIYFHDPFLVYVYAGSVPFFVALYRAFGLFGQAGRTGKFSAETVRSLASIKRCALILLGFVAGGIVIILINGDPDDRPAGLFMGLIVATPTAVVGTLAAKFARKLQSAPGQGI